MKKSLIAITIILSNLMPIMTFAQSSVETCQSNTLNGVLYECLDAYQNSTNDLMSCIVDRAIPEYTNCIEEVKCNS